MWAGITLAESSALAPQYWDSPHRGFMRARQTRRTTQPDPDGYMGVNVAFALLPWGILDNHRPEKWLLLITATAIVRDSQAAHM